MIAARLGQLFRLALSDLRHEWAITLCQVMSVAAVLAPLLVLYGLQQGVIGTLLERMDRDPAGARQLLDKAHSAAKEAVTELRVPLQVDVGFGPNWAKAK